MTRLFVRLKRLSRSDSIPLFNRSRCKFMDSIFIKNMVCNRCIMVVENELDKLNLDVNSVSLGKVDLNRPLTQEDKVKLKEVLLPLGFEVIDDKRSRIIESIKNIIIDVVHHQNAEVKINLSELLSSKLHLDYGYLSTLFSE